MSDEPKHVLLREDLAPAFHEEAVLAEIEQMAAQDKQRDEHVPYAAARRYHDDIEIGERYGPHVDECGYCRRMIDALSPTDELVDALQDFRKKAQRDRKASADEKVRWWQWSWRPAPAVLAMFAGVLGTWLVMSLQSPEEATRMADQLAGTASSRAFARSDEALDQLLDSPTWSQVLEAEDDPVAKFTIASVYRRLADQRLGEGLELVHVERNVIRAEAADFASASDPTSSLEGDARELNVLLGRMRLGAEEETRLEQLLARFGWNESVVDAVRATQVARGRDLGVPELDRAGLVSEDSGE